MLLREGRVTGGVQAPLADVAVHVPQAPGVRREDAGRGRVPTDAATVGRTRWQRLAEEVVGGRARPASVLPVDVPEQAKRQARPAVQLLTELLCLCPGHAGDRNVVVLLLVPEAAQDRTPLAL